MAGKYDEKKHPRKGGKWTTKGTGDSGASTGASTAKARKSIAAAFAKRLAVQTKAKGLYKKQSDQLTKLGWVRGKKGSKPKKKKPGIHPSSQTTESENRIKTKVQAYMKKALKSNRKARAARQVTQSKHDAPFSRDENKALRKMKSDHVTKRSKAVVDKARSKGIMKTFGSKIKPKILKAAVKDAARHQVFHPNTSQHAKTGKVGRIAAKLNTNRQSQNKRGAKVVTSSGQGKRDNAAWKTAKVINKVRTKTAKATRIVTKANSRAQVNNSRAKSNQNRAGAVAKKYPSVNKRRK